MKAERNRETVAPYGAKSLPVTYFLSLWFAYFAQRSELLNIVEYKEEVKEKNLEAVASLVRTIEPNQALNSFRVCSLVVF